MNTTSTTNYYPALDGIRGVAILLVVFFHNFGFLNYFVFGWLGVDLFFVLSGFLITNILLNTVGNRGYFKNFYVKRTLRIFPLYYSVLFITIIILPSIQAVEPTLQYYKTNQVWFWFYMQNWLFVLKPLEKTNLLIHFWSLAVEEQFYLVWPFIILFFRKPNKLLVLLSIFLLLLVVGRIVIWQHHIERLQYFSLYTFTRVDGICIGCMLALLLKIDPKLPGKYTGTIVFVLAIANFVFFFLNKEHSFTFPFFPFVGYTTIAVMFALLVYEVKEGNIAILKKIFSNSVLRFFGKISFGFYVFHWPIYVILNPKLKELFRLDLGPVSNAPMLLSSLVCTLIGLGVSVLSYHFFEIKFLKLKAHFN